MYLVQSTKYKHHIYPHSDGYFIIRIYGTAFNPFPAWDGPAFILFSSISRTTQKTAF